MNEKNMNEKNFKKLIFCKTNKVDHDDEKFDAALQIFHGRRHVHNPNKNGYYEYYGEDYALDH